MPTVRENLTYAYRDFARDHGVAAKRIAKRVLLMVLVAFLLETFVFNYNYFASRNYNSISMNEQLGLREVSEGQYLLTEANHVIELKNLNTEVHNVWINFDYRQPAQQLTLKIQFTDEAHRTYFDTTE